MSQATKVRTIEIEVNGKVVTLEEERGRLEATGAEIKAAAIAQGVAIRPDFVLFHARGSELDQVDDGEAIVVDPNQSFRAVAPDDNS